MSAGQQHSPSGLRLVLLGAPASGKGTQGQRLWVVPALRLTILRLGRQPSADWDETMIPNTVVRGTSGWQPAAAGASVDPNLYAPH